MNLSTYLAQYWKAHQYELINMALEYAEDEGIEGNGPINPEEDDVLNFCRKWIEEEIGAISQVDGQMEWLPCDENGTEYTNEDEPDGFTHWWYCYDHSIFIIDAEIDMLDVLARELFNNAADEYMDEHPDVELS